LSCGDDTEPAAEARPHSEHQTVRGGIPSGDAPTECEGYCRHANECAEREGRPVPEPARDCESACASGGTYASAPPATFACASEPCGEAFRRCSFDAMMSHMRHAAIGVFPPICEGMCNKLVHCALHRHEAVPPGLDDCARACGEGGQLAGTTHAELQCVNELCGQPFEQCMQHAQTVEARPNPAP
jgi:hypothetical protein